MMIEAVEVTQIELKQNSPRSVDDDVVACPFLTNVPDVSAEKSAVVVLRHENRVIELRQRPKRLIDHFVERRSGILRQSVDEAPILMSENLDAVTLPRQSKGWLSSGGPLLH